MNDTTTSSEMFRLRPADRADIDAVVAVFEACWSTSYATVLPAEVTAAMTPARSRALWSRVLAEAGPGEVIVAEEEGAVVGVTRWAVAEHGAPGWVHSLYVAPTAQGFGVGHRLLDAAEEAIRGAGADDARLWVFAANAPSIAFYLRNGWSPDGDERVEDEFGEPEMGMAKRLAER